MKIALDAGHGKNTAGKRCSKTYDPNETREWVLNDRVTRYVIKILGDYNVDILRVDDTTGKTDVSLETRCTKANNAKCDAYVSIHHNAGGGIGIETYCYSLDKNTTGYKLAKAINDSAVAATGNRNRGIKSDNFYVLRKTTMPAILIECGFMDNKEDTPKILSDSYAQKIASGIANAIIRFYKLSKNKKESVTKMKMYKHTTDMPEWAVASVRKAISKGIIHVGENGEISVYEPNLQVIVWMDRLELLS